MYINKENYAPVNRRVISNRHLSLIFSTKLALGFFSGRPECKIKNRGLNETFLDVFVQSRSLIAQMDLNRKDFFLN